MKPTPARTPGSAFPFEILFLGSQVSRAPRDGFRELRLRGGSLAPPRTPAGGASRGARTRPQGVRREDAHRTLSLCAFPFPAAPQSCSAAAPAHASRSAYLPGASHRSRWRPQNFPAERAGPGSPEGPKPEPGTPRRPSARAWVRDAFSRACPRRAQRIQTAPCSGDGLGGALRGTRAASGRHQRAGLARP